MLSTSVVRPFSKGVVSRVSRSSGFSPVYVQATEMTGMSIFGKMSVGGPKNHGRTQQENENGKNNERIRAIKS